MLQDHYEKHNLEMKPYQYYLAEFQNVNPENVTSRLDIPFDDNSKSFIIKFMAQIFRVERTKNFMVMSNHHFKNKNLTLKANSLLSLMLSLPDDWNYNMQGLATLSRDGIDSVRSAIKELEHAKIEIPSVNILILFLKRRKSSKVPEEQV